MAGGWGDDEYLNTSFKTIGDAWSYAVVHIERVRVRVNSCKVVPRYTNISVENVIQVISRIWSGELEMTAQNIFDYAKIINFKPLKKYRYLFLLLEDALYIEETSVIGCQL